MLKRNPGVGLGLWTAIVCLGLLCLFFVGLGLHSLWSSMVSLPATYRLLNESGVLTVATVDRCAPGIGGGRGKGCELSLTYEGARRVWDYPEDSAQFVGLPAGAQVPVLVDPRNPQTVYTVTDVRARTNAGFGPIVGFGIACIAAGAAGGWFLVGAVARFRKAFDANR